MSKSPKAPRTLYRVPAGTIYPATVAGYRLAKAGKLDEVEWSESAATDRVMEAPYPEIVSSWLANGVTVADGPAPDEPPEPEPEPDVEGEVSD